MTLTQLIWLGVCGLGVVAGLVTGNAGFLFSGVNGLLGFWIGTLDEKDPPAPTPDNDFVQ